MKRPSGQTITYVGAVGVTVAMKKSCAGTYCVKAKLKIADVKEIIPEKGKMKLETDTANW
jgi:hypothetical protein